MWLKVLARIITRTYTWIGGTDAGHEGHWIWESDVQTLVYTDFLKGQPNNHASNEHCLEMYSTGKTGAYTWNDLNCDVQRKFVCEKEIKKNPCSCFEGNGFSKDRHLTVINKYGRK